MLSKRRASHGLIGIEAPAIKGFMQNRKLSHLLNLLTSKVTAQGGRIVKVDRFFRAPHCTTTAQSGKRAIHIL
jgi:hypothetical protein